MDKTLTLARKLREKKMTVATAESCTGGLIAHLITSISGSSQYYTGSVVCYTNEIKMRLLGVSKQLIDDHTEVSGEVAQAMARGVMQLMQTDVGIATTGYAGPSGGTADQPVGTIWIAVTTNDRVHTQCFHFTKDREGNIRDAAQRAIEIAEATVE